MDALFLLLVLLFITAVEAVEETQTMLPSLPSLVVWVVVVMAQLPTHLPTMERTRLLEEQTSVAVAVEGPLSQAYLRMEVQQKRAQVVLVVSSSGG